MTQKIIIGLIKKNIFKTENVSTTSLQNDFTF